MSRDSKTAWRPDQRIRPIVLGVVWRGSDLLLGQVCDDDGGIEGWRPLGGGIEFGEGSSDALRREFNEELNAAIQEPRLLTVMENHYEHYGQVGHEIAFVFETGFVDNSVYERDKFSIAEGELVVDVEWTSFEPFRQCRSALFPVGLVCVLEDRLKQIAGGQP